MAQLSPSSSDQKALQQQIEQYSQWLDLLLQEVGTVIVGQKELLDRMLIGLLAQGHLLLEGVPGLAKTLTIHTLATCISLQFKRIQFTPDLLPADLIGTLIYSPQEGKFSPKLGPIFSNLILADEINRAPAKVQSALLEAMAEKQVTIGDTTYALPRPFLVMATQNPVEQEGTYPLPEAQLDRFMLKLLLTYPTREAERQIMDRMIEAPPPPPRAVLEPALLLQMQQILRQIYIAPPIKDYILDLVFSTREPERYKHTYTPPQGKPRPLRGYLGFGASPRATLAINWAARGHAMLQRRNYVTPDDIKAIARDVLRHRVSLTYEAEADGLSADDILLQVLHQLPVP